MTEENSNTTEDKVIVFHYTLTDDEGEVVESSKGGHPLAYLQGKGQIVPGLEKAMAGKVGGDSFKVDVAPEEGYGLKEGPGPQPVERTAFPEDAELHEGMMFAAEMPDGSQMPLWVTEVSDDKVMVDSNHPLAGETLHFDVEVVEVRDASDEELAHGHAHGPGGHQH